MAEPSLTLLIVVIAIAVIFDFANGFNDAANAIATVVSTRVLTPVLAVILAAFMNFLGAISGTAVAKVVGTGIVDAEAIELVTVAAGVGAAALWVLLASRLGLPVSGSHSLIAGVAGAAIATAGFDVLVDDGVRKVVLGLVFSLLLGFVGGYLIMLSLYWVLRNAAPSMVNGLFGKLQLLSAAAMAFSHGSNDAQKTMGVIALGLFVSGRIDEFHIPLWVILLSAVVMAAGTYTGGWRVVRTLGMRIVQMRPVNGFSAESAGAAVIEVATRLGIPLSTTHTIASTIMGQGATRRLSAVRWGMARRIALAWVFTFPICGLVAAGLLKLLEPVL